MKRLSLAVLAVAVAVVACSEVSTSPEVATDLVPRYDLSNPPPPDVDTMAAGESGGQTFELRVRYFFNKTSNAGWIKFDSELGDFSVDKNSQIRYVNGTFSGRGTILVGDLTIDLSRVSQTSEFSSCEPWTGGTTDRTLVGCFNLVIDGLDGTAINMTEGCATDPDVFDPRSVCFRSSEIR